MIHKTRVRKLYIIPLQYIFYPPKYKNTMKSQKSICLQETDNSSLLNTEYNSINSLSPDILVSIIIPIYNEEKSINEVLERIPNHRKYEVIVVDDGSTDNSITSIKNASKDILIVQHSKNKGYGAAILTGLKKAKGDIIVTIDSDGQHYPEEIPKIIGPILKNKADIVIGSRYLGTCNYNVPFHTRFGESFINFFLKVLFNKTVRNNQSGFRAFRRGIIDIFNELIYDNFGFCTEVVFKSALNNLRIKEIPITVDPRKYGTSYVRLMKILISISSCIFVYGLKKTRVLNFIPKVIYDSLIHK